MAIRKCTYCGTTPIYAKGLCRSCYNRLNRYGSPEPKNAGHPEADRKIRAWIENDRDYSKTAKVLVCSRQSVYAAVRAYYKPSNADNFRTKSDEELADWIVDMKMTGCPGDMFSTAWCQDMSCKDCWLDWLKKEAINESND